MRCQTAAARDCPSPERCEIEGCREPYNRPGSAIARERQPIDLPPLEDYQPGRIMRGLMALTDRGEKAVRRGPTPFAAIPAPATITYRPEEPPVMSQSLPAAMPLPIPGQEPAQPKPAAPTQQEDLRVVGIPGGWIVYRGAHPVAVASDPASLVARITELVRR
jgi:hypothetical protein